MLQRDDMLKLLLVLIVGALGAGPSVYLILAYFIPALRE